MSRSASLTPKLRFIPSTKAHRWYPFYAMFSDEFAAHIIADSGLSVGAVVLDPWVGAGTTIAAAHAKGHQGIGIDINPVMVTVARARTITKTAAEVVTKWLVTMGGVRAVTQSICPDDPLLDWFGDKTAAGFRYVQEAICDKYRDRPSEQAFLITALFDVAREATVGTRTKNPTWIRRSLGRRPSVPFEVILRRSEAAASRRISLCHEHGNDCDVRLGSSISLPLPDHSVDLVLTSPPYCTRIDYAVTTKVELAVLGKSATDVRSLRAETMGTTAIRDEIPQACTEWGQTCCRLLAKIRQHPSKGSANYYLKTYVQYFDDLYRSLSEIGRCARPSARVVVVVQDSRYKELHVDLPVMVSEMASNLRWYRISRTDYPVKTNLRRVNTRSRMYYNASDATEAVIEFLTPPREELFYASR